MDSLTGTCWCQWHREERSLRKPIPLQVWQGIACHPLHQEPSQTLTRLTTDEWWWGCKGFWMKMEFSVGKYLLRCSGFVCYTRLFCSFQVAFWQMLRGVLLDPFHRRPQLFKCDLPKKIGGSRDPRRSKTPVLTFACISRWYILARSCFGDFIKSCLWTDLMSTLLLIDIV